MSWILLLLAGLLFGVGFGYFAQRGGLCFAAGLGEVFAGRGKRIIRAFLLIFVITSLGFLLSGYVSPALGLKPVGEIRGFGFYNLISGLLFGAGIFLSGGCVLGTLRQIGEGSMIFVVVFVSMIPGMALVVYGIEPLIREGYQVQNPLIPDLLNVPSGYVTGVLVLAALGGLYALRRRPGKDQ